LKPKEQIKMGVVDARVRAPVPQKQGLKPVHTGPFCFLG